MHNSLIRAGRISSAFGPDIQALKAVQNLWKSFWQWQSESRVERRTRTALMSLTDRELKDIGIARPEIMRVARYGRDAFKHTTNVERQRTAHDHQS